MKSNTLKKVLSITIISIILAVAITTMILAFVQKSLYNPMNDINDTMSNYHFVTLCKDGVANGYFKNETASEESREVVAKIDDLMEKSTKSSILSQMFQGTGSFEARIIAKDAGNVMDTVAKADGKVCLVFDYLDDEQTLMWEGEEYKNSQAKDPNAPVTFRKIFIPISKTEEFEVCTAYLADKNDKSVYQIEFLAHQSEIYEYMVSLTWEFQTENN